MGCGESNGRGVTIVTNDFYIFQGTLVERGNCEEESEFILLRLSCFPTSFVIPNTTTIFVAVPFFNVGDVIKIAREKIIAIRPSEGDCLANGVS